jgi:hypothetical protein
MANIQLLIKNPSAHVEDFRVQIEANKTVGHLKQHLATSYPGNPPSERQVKIFVILQIFVFEFHGNCKKETIC